MKSKLEEIASEKLVNNIIPLWDNTRFSAFSDEKIEAAQKWSARKKILPLEWNLQIYKAVY